MIRGLHLGPAFWLFWMVLLFWLAVGFPTAALAAVCNAAFLAIIFGAVRRAVSVRSAGRRERPIRFVLGIRPDGRVEPLPVLGGLIALLGAQADALASVVALGLIASASVVLTVVRRADLVPAKPKELSE